MVSAISEGILRTEHESGLKKIQNGGWNMAAEVYKNLSDLLDRHIGCAILNFLNLNEDL